MTRKLKDPIQWLLEYFSTEIRAIHELKSHPAEFDALAVRTKRHEVRRFDRDYQVGDYLFLRRWDPETGKYTGEQLFREITHITPPGAFGLPDDVGVLAVR